MRTIPGFELEKTDERRGLPYEKKMYGILDDFYPAAGCGTFGLRR